MKYDPDIHHRQSIRLKDYDYSSSGMYFITICTENKINLFGEIINKKIVLNNAGKMIDEIFCGLEDEFENISLNKYILMPNHLHAIIFINNPITMGDDVGADSISALDLDENRVDMESTPTLGDIIQSFKRHTTIKYIKGVKNNIYPPFKKRIWQRNYYEHIIRNKQEYEKTWEYIDINPLKWELDKYYCE